MKKKFLLIAVLLVGAFCFAACKKTSNLNIEDFLIEQREILFVGEDETYNVNLTGGMVEESYAFDGQVNTLVPFGILSISRKDGNPLAIDIYSYSVDIDGENYTGELEVGSAGNYCADLGVKPAENACIKVVINFSGNSFEGELENASKTFVVDCPTAISIANNELKDGIKNVLSTKDNQVEAIMKIVNDYSSESGNYYWYVGVVATNGEMLGVLIDANTGAIIAKKL